MVFNAFQRAFFIFFPQAPSILQECPPSPEKPKRQVLDEPRRPLPRFSRKEKEEKRKPCSLARLMMKLDVPKVGIRHRAAAFVRFRRRRRG